MKKDDHIGFTTVYRTASASTSGYGLASKWRLMTGSPLNISTSGTHHHMVCTECGGLGKFFTRHRRIEQEIGRKNKYLPRGIRSIYGICDKCQKKQKRARSSP